MTSRPARYVAVAVLTATFVLAGCTSPATSTTNGTGGPTTSVGSATGVAATGAPSSDSASDAVTGRSGGYSVVPPEGWAVATDKAGDAEGLDLVLLSSARVANFSNNLVILVADGDESVLTDELDKGRSQLSGNGRTIGPAPDLAIGGERATGFSATFEQQGIKIKASAYGLHHAGKVYLLTLSSSQQDAENAAAELTEIIDTWSWT